MSQTQQSHSQTNSSYSNCQLALLEQIYCHLVFLGKSSQTVMRHKSRAYILLTDAAELAAAAAH